MLSYCFKLGPKKKLLKLDLCDVTLFITKTDVVFWSFYVKEIFNNVQWHTLIRITYDFREFPGIVHRGEGFWVQG